MKFVALALVLLLAGGCQAELEQTDDPSKYEQIRAAVVNFLTKTKELAQRAVANLDDAEFSDFKVLFNQDLDTIEANIKSVAEYLAPVHDRVGPKIGDLISAGHETFSRDLDEVCKELDQKLAELNEVLKKLREEYHKFLDPVYQNVIYPFVNMIMTYSVNVFIELREIPVVYAIINDIFEFIAELDSTYGGDIRREWIKIEHAIGPLFEKCEWLQRWKLI